MSDLKKIKEEFLSKLKEEIKSIRNKSNKVRSVWKKWSGFITI